MNITEYLKKPYWARVVHKDNIPKPPHDPNGEYYFPKGHAEPGIQYLTQEDFLNELSAEAHEVNSMLVSRRPVYEPDGKDAKGNTKWKIVRYDDVEKSVLGLTERISSAKAAHFGDFWVANETTKAEEFDTMMSWVDSSGLKVAFMEAVLHTFQTGDAAIYLYKDEDTIEYKVFSKHNSDTLFPHYDEDRKLVIYRKYSLEGRPAVDVISTKYYETWVKMDSGLDDSRINKWSTVVTEWFKGSRRKEVSDDGYTLMSRKESQISGKYNQVTYFRVKDVPWGPAWAEIQSLERSLSFVAEDVKSNAFPTLFLKATKITSLPGVGSHSRVIGARGSAEEIANADAKTIQAGDMSNIATVHLKELASDIVRTTMTVFVEPEILKAGADSSTTIKIMFAPEIQWCKCMWPQFFHPTRDMMEVFKRLVGSVEGDISKYAGLRTSIGNEVWIPQNDKEKTDIVATKVYAGVLSEKNARNEVGNQYIDDYEQIKKEREEKLYRENYIPTQAKAEAEAKYGVQDASTASTEPSGGAVVKPNMPVQGSASQHIDNRNDRKNVATQRD